MTTQPTRARARAWVAALAVLALAGACSSSGSSAGPTPVASAGRTTAPADVASDQPNRSTDGWHPVQGGHDGSLDGVSIRLRQVAKVDSPTALAPRPGTNDLYVTERAGRVRVLHPRSDGTLAVGAQPVLDVSDEVSTDGEMGLLGLAFSADGERLYVDWNSADRTTHLVAYRMDGDVADPSTRTVLLTQTQPFVNHKGGNLVLGPDGMLWFGLGDGGSGNDPSANGPNPNVWLGKLLRIDPAGGGEGRPYGVPATNPYARGGGKPEVAVIGLRNPWRFSFDKATGDLWIGDVGQDVVEEVDHLPAGKILGADLGWSGLEGTRVNIPARVTEHPVPPVFEYTHDAGSCAVTGGFVYRGKAIPKLQGAYVFSDACKSTIRALRLGADGQVSDSRAGIADTSPSTLESFGQDQAGELYALDLAGPISRLQQG